MKAVMGCKGDTSMKTAADAFGKNAETSGTLRDAQMGFIAK